MFNIRKTKINMSTQVADKYPYLLQKYNGGKIFTYVYARDIPLGIRTQLNGGFE